MQADQENYHQGNYISVSMLSGSQCPRQTVYERTHPFYEQPTRRYWSFRGTHAHSIIERAKPLLKQHGWLQELRMAVPFEYPERKQPVFDSQGTPTGATVDEPLVITVGGTCDAYQPLQEPYPLWDFKSMADIKAQMFIKGAKGGTFSPNLEDRWVWQLNMYRYLISRTPVDPTVRAELGLTEPYYPMPGFLGIQGISMMTIPRTGMPHPAKSGYESQVHEIDNVPLLPVEQVEAEIRTQALRWFDWLVMREPAPVVPKDMDWLCRNCPFNGEMVSGAPCMPAATRKAQQTPAFELE
jgi:hypothetical protein